MSASEFKTKCLAVLDEVGESGARWWMPQLSLGTGMEFLSDFSNPSGRRQRINGVQLVLPFALRFPFGLELSMQSTIGVGGGTSGVSGPRQKQDVLVPNTDFGDRVEGRPTLNRVTSFEAGYRFRRQERLSFRPGVRLSWADYELWDIRNTVEDGTVLRSSDARMSRADPALYLGPVAEAAWAFSDRLVLRATDQINAMDWDRVTADVSPFLESSREIAMLTRENVLSVLKPKCSEARAAPVRRNHANLLGGRGVRYELLGLSAAEIGPGIDLVRLLNQGYLPPLYTADQSRTRALLDAYVSQYIKAEIAAEGLARNLPSFGEFLSLAA